jgi:hypothetical protein
LRKISSPRARCFPKLYFHSQTRSAKPCCSMNAWQRGQRPGFFHGSTKCFADTGHDNFILCHSNRRGSARFDANKLSRRITGGISCPVNAEKFLANSVRPVARRTRVKTSNNFRHSRQMTVCTSQFNPPTAPPETLARYWHCGHSKRNVLPTAPEFRRNRKNFQAGKNLWQSFSLAICGRGC